MSDGRSSRLEKVGLMIKARRRKRRGRRRSGKGAFFSEEEHAAQNGEERRHFIEHAGVGEQQMVHSIEVAQDSQRSEDGAYDQIKGGFAFKRKSLSAAQKNNRSEDCGYKISKKTLLYRGRSPESLTKRLIRERKMRKR